MVTPTAAPVRLRRWALLALLASAVVCTGCIRVEIGIRLNDDGSGAISILSALDAEALRALRRGRRRRDRRGRRHRDREPLQRPRRGRPAARRHRRGV